MHVEIVHHVRSVELLDRALWDVGELLAEHYAAEMKLLVLYTVRRKIVLILSMCLMESWHGRRNGHDIVTQGVPPEELSSGVTENAVTESALVPRSATQVLKERN